MKDSPPMTPLDDEPNEFMRLLMTECGVTAPEYHRATVVQDCESRRDRFLGVRLCLEVPIPQGAFERVAEKMVEVKSAPARESK